MELNLDRAVERVTLVNAERSGTFSTRRIQIRRRQRRQRRQSATIRAEERLTRRIARALQDGVQEYLKQHDRSNRSRRNGWVRDMDRNLARAQDRVLDRLIP